MESLAVRNSQVPEFDPSGGTFDFQIIYSFQSMENLQHIYTRYQYSISHQIYMLYIVYLSAKIVRKKIFTLTCLSSFYRLRVTHGHRNANDNGEETPELTRIEWRRFDEDLPLPKHKSH